MKFKFFGDQLRKARLAKGKTIAQIAEIIEVHETRISRFDSGDYTTISEGLQKYCDYLGIKISNEILQHERLLKRVQTLIELSNDNLLLLDLFISALERNQKEKLLSSVGEEKKEAKKSRIETSYPLKSS